MPISRVVCHMPISRVVGSRAQDKIDNIVSAEIPDPALDPELHQIMVSNMVHGPYGSINPTSPCMENDKCSKKYPKPFISETQQGADSFPLYRKRNPEDGG